MRGFLSSLFLLTISPFLFAKAIIDADILQSVRPALRAAHNASADSLSLLVFLHTTANKETFLKEVKRLQGVQVQDLGFMPALAMQIPKNQQIVEKIANLPAVAQISSNKEGAPELDISAQALKLVPSSFYPEVNNWWAHGYTGKKGVVGIIDTGVDPTHPALANKTILIREEGGSEYSDYRNGVRAPHATGVACIYASNDGKYKGMAYDAPTIISGPAGAETAAIANIMLTMGTLDWMLHRISIQPTIINYSMGNGRLDVDCPVCPDWSGLARVVDYVVNTQKILWVKSAGNNGYIPATGQRPFATTLTVPADNYNGLTVANMNTVVTENNTALKTADRSKHQIKDTSSRGPTPFGRRKPDITAPGHDTRTCAPLPEIYHFNYSKTMDYKAAYRLMGGTSAAAPHVGAAALLLQDAGITNPMAIKALLINSADTWTDRGTANVGHTEIMGSEWNRTYGWGYLNMDKAFKEREFIKEGELTLEKPVFEYATVLKRGQKVTLVHERRVGYTELGKAWKLSHLTLELIDPSSLQTIAKDDSQIDTVHQVANCKRAPNDLNCSEESQTMPVLIRVTLLNKTIDGSASEPFVIVAP